MEKINVAKLLKDCPKGMELDCTICNGVKFIELDRNPNFAIVVRANNGYEFSLTKYGQVHNIDDAKCVILPKGKTTWEGFVPPSKFKDGDIVATDSGRWLGIIKNKYNSEYYTVHCAIDYTFNDIFYRCGEYRFSRLATEEEKSKLFQAIKENGYKWNEETKTLEKLSPNKFDITTLVPFESRVLVRNDESQYWIPAFWGCKRADGYTTTFGWCKYCIPFEGNEHLLETTNDCNEYYKTWK